MERCLSGGNMRLIDADLLMRKCDKWLKFNKVYDEADAKYHESDFDSFWGGGCSMIQEVIKETAEQPTAYDVNKVVNKLEMSKKTALDLVKLPHFFIKSLQELVDICFDRAIEIVKAGDEQLEK